MTIWAFRTMIVPSDYRAFASSLASAVGGTAGENMFTTGLSASGQEPATHYVSTGYISEQFALLLPLYDPSTGAKTDGDPATVTQLANDGGFTCTVQEVTDLFAVVDVTEQQPFDAFARLGLQIAQPVAPIE